MLHLLKLADKYTLQIANGGGCVCLKWCMDLGAGSSAAAHGGHQCGVLAQRRPQVSAFPHAVLSQPQSTAAAVELRPGPCAEESVS